MPGAFGKFSGGELLPAGSTLGFFFVGDHVGHVVV